MSYREIRRLISSFLYFYSAILSLPFFIALYFQVRISEISHPQPHSTMAFGLTVAISLGCAWLLGRNAGKASAMIYRHREALAAVVLIWVIAPAIGALPFVFSGTLERFDQAYFEAVSGFSTTGATVLESKQYDPMTGEEILIHQDFVGTHKGSYEYYGTVRPVDDPLTGEQLVGVEAVGPALLFWRSFMQWIGGVGIVVLFVALLPELGIQGKFLFQSETPGPVKEGFKPRIKETAVQLWAVYAILTFLEVLFLFAADPSIPLFDAVTLSFSTLSTGGFTVHNESVAFYHKAGVEWVVLIFMVFGGINFSLYYYIMIGKFYRIFDRELLGYLGFLIFLGLLVVFNLWGIPQQTLLGEILDPYSFTEALRIGLFQLVSIQTSTGFSVNDYDVWPNMTHVIFLVAMYLGGMSGSTAGGMKIIRIQILFKSAKAKIESVFQPKIVSKTRLGNLEIDQASSLSVFCFFFIAIALSVFSTFLYVFDGVDPETSLGLTGCMVNNIGLAFKAAGPTHSMAFLSPFSTYLSSFLMILGRLEYYALLVFFMPSFWKRF